MDSQTKKDKDDSKKKTKRCNHITCNKKLVMFDFICKCDNHFCMQHRNPEDHNCTFDFKKISDLEINSMVKNKCEYEKINLI